MKTKYILIIVALGICISMGVQHLSADNQLFIEIPGELHYFYLDGLWIIICDCGYPAIDPDCWCQKFIPPGDGV